MRHECSLHSLSEAFGGDTLLERRHDVHQCVVSQSDAT
jgi:hypothetical protein